jgi:histidyl-tRNA synthetase
MSLPSKKQSLQRPKGTQDIFGEVMAQWHHVERIAHKLFGRFGYQEIRTPCFESTDLFLRGVGETTDIVNKEMYTFEKGDRSLTLRPEGTAGLARAFIEQGMSRWAKPVKLYYMGAMFRYERPQAGRQRQFHQVGMELYGMDTPAADAEVIFMAIMLFKQLGLPGLTLKINNIGTPSDREQFKADLKQHLKPVLPNLCEDCQTRYAQNPLRLLDCKQDSCKAHYQEPAIKTFLETDFTGAASQADFNTLLDTLDKLGIPYQRDPYLVRGLDYYTKMVFEITSSHLGAQNTVCGGGRYNELVEELGGSATPACGWAVGLERLVSLIAKTTIPVPDYYIVTDCHAEALMLATEIHQCGFSAEVDLSQKAFGKQLEKAFKVNARQVILLGEADAKQDQLTCKNVVTAEQSTLSRQQFLEQLKKSC